MERPEEPFAIAVRDIDESLECLRLRWGSEAPRSRVRLDDLDEIKPQGQSCDAPVHTRGGEYSTQRRKKIQGALNKHHYEALTTMGQSGTLTDRFARKLVPGFFLGQLRPRQIFDRRRILRALEDREAVGDLNI